MKKERKDKNFIKKPIYPGGVAAMRAFIKENLKYPRAALEHKTEGTVSLKYTIDHNGKVIDTHIVAGLGHGCDEEAARLARLLKFEVPKTRGVKVTFHKDLHIHFRLPKKSAPKQIKPNYVFQPSGTSTQTSSVSYTITITPRSDKRN